MTDQEQREAYKACFWVILLAAMVLFFTAKANAQQWRESDIPIYYNSDDSPYSYVDVSNAIKYASWIAEKRTGVVSHYSGDNSLITPNNDTIQVIWDIPDSGSIGSSLGWTYVNDGLRAKSLVKLNPDRVDSYCMEFVTVHEIAHSLTMRPHVNQMGELMNHSPDLMCKAGLGQLSASLSAYDSGDTCFVELLPSGDLFIPNFNGMAAYLWQTSEYEWSLYHYHPAGGESCNTVSMDGNDIIMTDVQGYPGTQFTLVELENTAPDTWALRFAQ